ncbi:hypothetical protein MNB_SV-4-937 [hydrothermal vent metagenome]|uniref:HPt domain-containing protein n=1 Tax=hydrothermal vent metagenome TaxID=652676 RepID=A0A1W1E9K9_9ZZZZ
MQKLLEETKEKAYIFLREFGFEEDELEPVINKGLKELEESLVDLLKLINSESIEYTYVDTALHDLKGLLFQLGNHNAANKVELLRHVKSIDEIKNWIENL